MSEQRASTAEPSGSRWGGHKQQIVADERPHILIADNNEEALENMTAALRNSGFLVTAYHMKTPDSAGMTAISDVLRRATKNPRIEAVLTAIDTSSDHFDETLIKGLGNIGFKGAKVIYTDMEGLPAEVVEKLTKRAITIGAANCFNGSLKPDTQKQIAAYLHREIDFQRGRTA